MIARFKYVLVALLCSHFVFGQAGDALKRVELLKTETNDSIRMEILNDLTGANRFNRDVGIAYANKILAMGPLLRLNR